MDRQTKNTYIIQKFRRKIELPVDLKKHDNKVLCQLISDQYKKAKTPVCGSETLLAEFVKEKWRRLEAWGSFSGSEREAVSE